MRATGGRGGAKLTPVDADSHQALRPVELDTRRYDPMFEERLLRAQFKRERSSAYWFAASTWGIAGLVLGACMGAYMMYAATVATLPTAVTAVTQGMAVSAIRGESDTRHNLIDGEPRRPSSAP